MNLLAALFLFLPAVAFAQAPNPAEERALREIDAWSMQQARSDPLHSKIEAEVLTKVDAIVAGSAPAEWLPAIKRQYLAASERLHREERERIRAIEVRARPLGPTNLAPEILSAQLQARFGALTSMLEAGTLGPREHAIHAAEAAALYYPNDAALIRWREAKVPIAGAYELGRLTRDEYVERWQRATDAYNQTRSARSTELERLAAEEARGFQDLSRPTTRTTCTSQIVLGRLQTVCR